MPTDFPDIQQVLKKCAALARMGSWPRTEVIDPSRWIGNFREGEIPYASSLLDSFSYYSEDLWGELFNGAFSELARTVCGLLPSKDRVEAWKDFRASAIVVPVEGETTSPTDSGLIFARKARQRLFFSDRSLKHANEALRELRVSKRPIIFVDDYLCSGQQFEFTWMRPRENEDSFHRFFEDDADGVFYCPLFASGSGKEYLEDLLPGLKVCATHILRTDESARSSSSKVWPDGKGEECVRAIESIGNRLGLHGEMLWGVRELGLTVALSHCIPDAAVALFHLERDGWYPLMRKN